MAGTTKKTTKKEAEMTPKQQALELAMAQIEKTYGKGSIMKLGDDTYQDIEVIPTGALSLDLALGVGGVPRGRIVEIYGPESSGKTTLALHIIAEAQKAGGTAAFIDAEHAMDPVYAGTIGVDVDNLLLSQPDFGEQALEIVETLVRSGAVDIIVIDSVAALTPRAEIEGDMGDSHMGLQARLMSQALRKITAIAAKSKCTIVFLNQIRMKIGVMFGNPETTTGGNALKFYSSIRMDIRRRAKITKGDDIIGNIHQVKVVKNKVAPPFRQATFEIRYPYGIDRVSSAVDAAVECGIFEKSGSWYKYDGKQVAQGKDAVMMILKEDKKMLTEIARKVRAIVREGKKSEK